MKRIAIFFLISVLLGYVIKAQDTPPSRIKLFKLTITKTDGGIQRGYFYGVSDSAVSLLRYNSAWRPRAGIQSIPAGDINHFMASTVEKMSVQRKKSTGRGILVGCISGVVVGAITGAITHKENPGGWDFGPGVDAVAGGTIGLLGGGIIGGIIGAVVKKKFVIGGNKEKLQLIRPELQAYTIRPE